MARNFPFERRSQKLFSSRNSPHRTLHLFMTSRHISLRFIYLSVVLSSMFSLPRGLSYSMSLKYCTYTSIRLTPLLWFDNSHNTSWRVLCYTLLSHLAVRILNFTSHYSFILGPIIILTQLSLNPLKFISVCRKKRFLPLLYVPLGRHSRCYVVGTNKMHTFTLMF